GGMPVAEDPHRGRDIQSFGQRREDLTHALGWGFEAVERSITARAKRGVTSLAAQRLDPLAPPVPSVANQGGDLGLGDPRVGPALIGTGEALRINPFGCPPAAFLLAPGCHRCARRGHCRRDGRLLTAGRAIVWGTRFEEPLDTGRDGSRVRRGVLVALP